MNAATLPESAAPAPELSIREYLIIIQRRKLVFVNGFVMVLAAGIVATALSKPVYMTHAKLLVPAGSSSVNLVDSNNPIAAMLASAQPDSVATQMQVLQSAPFMD